MLEFMKKNERCLFISSQLTASKTLKKKADSITDSVIGITLAIKSSVSCAELSYLIIGPRLINSKTPNNVKNNVKIGKNNIQSCHYILYFTLLPPKTNRKLKK